MRLSDHQIGSIRAHIARGIRMQTLQDDVLDHVCCALEKTDDPEGKFEESVKRVLDELAPAGLQQLEHETLLLLNSKYSTMKKIMYVIGLISAIASSMGICFKLLHLPGADFLLTYGLLTLTLVYLPMQAVIWFKSYAGKNLLERLQVIFTLISGLFTGIAIVLRLFHVTGTSVELIFIGSAVIFSFGYLPILFFNQYRKTPA